MPEHDTCGIPTPHPQHLWSDPQLCDCLGAAKGHLTEATPACSGITLTRYCAGVPLQPAIQCSKHQQCEFPDGHDWPCWPPPELSTRAVYRVAPCGSSEPHAGHEYCPTGNHKHPCPSAGYCSGLTGKVPDDHDKIIQLRKDLDAGLAEVSALKNAVSHQQSVLKRLLEAVEEALRSDESPSSH